ncbi:MAG: CPXCG motif-containing cysteine-rich protein [Myxococcales bacterium]|nr:CPXCG motif-containing cysteine-rich protein [Myxococcales bacterium]
MDDTVTVYCPYCGAATELYVDPETTGAFVEDCALCCNPWRVEASRDEEGNLTAHVERAQ